MRTSRFRLFGLSSFAPVLLTLCVGCGAAESTKSPPPEVNELADRDSAELYAWDHVPTFELALPAGEFEHLLATAADEKYTRATLTFEGKPVGDVGLRFKGSVGTLQSCFDAQGNLICPKLSMKLGFDEYVPTTRFFRQKRLNLHSMIRDDTKLHERLAYDLFRSRGIAAPRSAWAVVKVNGESLGLFSMVEQIDGRFTANRWPGVGDGNLYKEAWPLSTDTQYYEEHLEAGPKDGAATHTAYVDFTRALAAGGDGGGRDALGRYMDLDYLARYMAVDDAVLNVDGVTATYTGDDPRYYANHNFYVYQEEQRDFFWLVPWDMDATFNLRGDFELVPRWNASTADCTRSYTVWGQARVVASTCDPLFRALASDQASYQAAVEDLLAGDFSEAKINEAIDRHAAFIASAVEQDPKGAGMSAWRGAVEFLKQRIPLIRAHLGRAKLGLSSRPLVIAADGVTDFEQEDSYSVSLGATPQVNPRSTVAATIGSVQPLAGKQDLRVDFEYRNESTGWMQWMYFPLRFDNPRDLRSLSGVRFLARADSARTLRVDIESPVYEAGNEGIKFGWEVAIGPEAQPVEVRFASAALPTWAHATADVLANVLAKSEGLSFHPFCAGRTEAGQLPEGTSDPGHLELDDIQFF